jgi:hypothetical protein
MIFRTILAAIPIIDKLLALLLMNAKTAAEKDKNRAKELKEAQIDALTALEEDTDWKTRRRRLSDALHRGRGVR